MSEFAEQLNLIETLCFMQCIVSDKLKYISFVLLWSFEINVILDNPFVDGFLNGGDGSIDLANRVVEALETTKSKYHTLYKYEDTIENKIAKIAKEIYHASDVQYEEKALRSIENIRKLNRENLPICIAKTQSSFSDDSKLLNVPRNFTLHVKDIHLSNGAGFIVVLTGNILTMPGLPKVPAAVKMENETIK